MSQDEYILDRDSVRSVDRAAIEEYGIPGMVLMENAARGLTERAVEMLGNELPGAEVLIICGTGNNGGDGYALARHLHNAGARPVLAALGEPRRGSDAATNRATCERMDLAVIDHKTLDEHIGAALIVDAIFGTGLDRAVEGRAAEVIAWINALDRPVLAVDVPSGLDCDTGRPLGRAVMATVTVTFVARKPGFLVPEGRRHAGRVTVADIGAPCDLVARFGRPIGSVADRRT